MSGEKDEKKETQFENIYKSMNAFNKIKCDVFSLY